MPEKVIILGVNIDDISLRETLERVKQALEYKNQISIFTPNPEICLKAVADENYRHILNSGSINIPDGIGLKYGAKILGQTLQNKTCGSDLTAEILNKLTINKVFIVSRLDALSQKSDIDALFKKIYPAIKVKSSFLDKNNPFACEKVLNEINAFEPQILFVCLGASSQETWIYKFLKFLPSVNCALAIGGSFDFLTDKIKRAPKALQKMGLEWVYRLYQEPSRIKRIKNATADFLLTCHDWAKRIKSQYRDNVVAVIRNKEGKFLIQKSIHLNNHWQFPQGGIDEGETPEQAVVREVCEEIGTQPQFLNIIKKLPAENTYDWPTYAQLIKGYKGQKQTAFLLEFIGQASDINLQDSHEAEQIEWVDKDELLTKLHPVRRVFAKKLIKFI